MANLDIKITTKYDQAQQGFEKVTKSVRSYRQELVDAKTQGKGVDTAIQSYTAALNKSLQSTDYMKDGMTALKTQAKLLKEQIFELNSAFGADDKLVKQLKGALADVNAEMANLQKTTKTVSKEGMGELEKSSGNAATKLLSVAKNILKFQLLMGPITSVVRGFRNTISDSIKVAAEAEQTFSKLSTVFMGLESSATAAANAISSKLGVATSTAAGALSTVGDLLQAQGMGTSASLSTSSEWVSQFQDIIAFKDINMSLEEFAQTFMSGAAGNLRNFRTFGSIVKESQVQAVLASKGLDKLTGSELELAKMTTRATLALEQQKNAMGATEREWDTMLSVNRRLNEAWKEYKENLGSSINEAMKPAKIWLTEILEYTNDIARVLKEIDGGEFTVKVRQDGSVVEDSIIMKALNAAKLSPSLNATATRGSQHGSLDITSSDVVRNAMKKNSRTTSGVAVYSYSAQELAMAMKATGANVDEMKAAIDAARAGGEAIAEISDATWAAASASVQAYWDLQEALEEARNAVLSSAEGYDTFTESLANLAHISVRSTNLTAIGEGMNEYNYEDIMQTFGQTAQGQMSSILKSVMSQFGGFNVGTFTSDFDKAFGTGNAADAYKSWMSEIESLYTILLNREVQFGDVGQNVLDDVIDMWGLVNRELDTYNKGLQEAADREAALKTAQGVASDYRSQLDNYGKSSFSVTYNSLLSKRDSALSGAEANLYEDAARDFKTLTAKELVDSFSAIAYAAEMATIGMTENEKALYELEQQYLEAAKSEALTEDDQKKLTKNYEAQRDALIELQKAQDEYQKRLEREAAVKAAIEARNSITAPTTWQTQLSNFGLSSEQIARNGLVAQRDALSGKHDPLWVSYQREIDALDEFVKKTEEAAKEMDRMKAWAAVEKRVTGSMGTMGGIIETFQGEGDIWTKLVNALLTILENTESWPKIAETLDSIFNMFEPVAEALLDLIMSLPWKDIIFMLKVVASAITIISGIVQGIQTVIKWLWENIKTALRNVATDVYNLFHPFNQRSRDQYTSFEELGNMLAKIYDDTTVYLERIWNANEDIVRNTDKDDLKVLRDLYARKIINEDQFYAGARVLQSDMVFDPVSADSSKYVTSSGASSSSVSYGGVTIQFNGSNTEEIKRWITDFFSQNGMGYNMAIGG